MRLKTLLAGFAFALTTTAAFAAYNNVVVKFQNPVPATDSAIALGAIWACSTDTCTTVLERKTPQVRDCRQVARAFGPVASFSVGGASLDEAGLAACNTAAK